MTVPFKTLRNISFLFFKLSLDGHSRTARVLLAMSIPGHVIFLAIISSLKAGHTSTTARFFCMYILAGFVQVSLARSIYDILLDVLGFFD